MIETERLKREPRCVLFCKLFCVHREKLSNINAMLQNMALRDRWVQAEVNELLERRLSPNPLVTIHKYPGADHAFARLGGKTYSKPEADRALALSLDFFGRHLA